MLIIGLGNPGAEYFETRHNVGFDTVELLSKRLNFSFIKKPFRPVVLGHVNLSGKDFYFAKPQTYMNKSGFILPYLLNKTQSTVSDILVVCDNLDLPAGSARLKQGKSSGGHNGLKSIASFLETDGFLRLYIGIGRPEKKENVIQHVLGQPLGDDKININQSMEKSADEIIKFMQGQSLQQTMNNLNKK